MSHNSTSMLNNKFRENFPLEKKFWTLWIKPENDKNGIIVEIIWNYIETYFSLSDISVTIWYPVYTSRLAWY